MSTKAQNMSSLATSAKEASNGMRKLPTKTRNNALENIAIALEAHTKEILLANDKDCDWARKNGLQDAIIDRLVLNASRLKALTESVREIIALPDPTGEVFDMSTRPNGMIVGRKRTPLGVIGAIYESRPDVTVELSALCIKSGNCCILRGGKEAFNSNLAISNIIRDAIGKSGIPKNAVTFVESTDRSIVLEMLQMKGLIDLLIPRGGAEFIKFVADNANVPVITGGVGVCHTYVDKTADIEKAIAIVFNAKVQRPSVCNALDTLIIHKDIAPSFLPRVARKLSDSGVRLRCDKASLQLLADVKEVSASPAKEDDWGKEFLDLIASVKIVDSADAAMSHIDQYGSGHSEAIITEDYTNGTRFLEEVDAAAVYINASTRLTDGGQFGLGAEVAVSTDKLHARGPMGLKELTSYKWIIFGQGHIRE